MGRARRGWRRLALPLLALAVGAALLLREGPVALPGADPPPATPSASSAPATGTSAGARHLAALFRTGRSGVWVEAQGVVAAVLPDDRRGSRHQRLIVRTGPDQTVLLSHNVDLAPRLEGVAPGDRVAFRGRYEWNPEGGVVHWTHHDPRGRRAGGWVRHAGTLHR
ncbi:MAG: DUF3465 domain-containing protein [Myxococcota bacterium]|nr:DUF3465 domain-containing protein [Myxococcota bacterium]